LKTRHESQGPHNAPSSFTRICATHRTSQPHHTSHFTRHTSHFTRHTSHVTRHTSHVTPPNPPPPSWASQHHLSSCADTHQRRNRRGTGGSPACNALHVTRHTSYVTRHMSHVTRHTSHVTRHTSHVTRHLISKPHKMYRYVLECKCRRCSLELKRASS